VSPELRFAVLGPIRVWRGDTELDPGPRQQQAVLAVLLLAEGRQVPLAALIDALWEEPPRAATGMVRTYVSRLRQCLATGAGEVRDVIKSAGDGYVLPLGPAALDLHAFLRLTKDAQTARSGSTADAALAGKLLREALDLWQGLPLAGVPGPYAVSQRVRLAELQMAAIEERLAIDIELGRHTAVVAELQALLASHPLRERFSELLMLALYRAGRQADALAVFDDARRLLSEELGIYPGPAIRDLHQRILQRDEGLIGITEPQGLAAAPDASPLVPLVRPGQLPADLSAFTGRAEGLAQLDSLLANASHAFPALMIAAIDGMAGIGKTALAVHWAHQVAGQFPDGQLYLNLRGFDPSEAVTPGEALRRFLNALGMAPQQTPDDLETQAGLYRSLMNGRRILILLDNARDVEQVRPLLPGSPGCLVIVTSRHPLTGLITTHNARVLTLDPFPADEARQALARRLSPARLAAGPHALAKVVELCAGLPLALAIVAARATVHRDLALTAIASELCDARTRLDALSTDDAATDVRAVFSWSYRLLSTPARCLFRLAAVHTCHNFSQGTAASLAGVPVTAVLPLLKELTAARLIIEHRPGRFTFHDLIRVYAAELSAALDSDYDRHAALGRCSTPICTRHPGRTSGSSRTSRRHLPGPPSQE
jgi:DNA-binding SARP family transcriptional activator